MNKLFLVGKIIAALAMLGTGVKSTYNHTVQTRNKQIYVISPSKSILNKATQKTNKADNSHRKELFSFISKRNPDT